MPGSPISRLAVAVVTTMIAVGATLACSVDGGGAGEGDEPSPAATSSSDPTAASGAGGTATEVPTELRECVPGKGDVTVPLTVAAFDYTVPPGFAPTSGISQIADAEGDHEATYLLLDGADGIEVVTLVLYRTLENGPVTDGCGVLDLELVQARLADHNERSTSVVTDPPTLTEVAGSPALVEDRRYPQHGMEVRHYWIYAQQDLLNVQCQWTTHREEVLAGCDQLIGSLDLG